jgi:hypothetical protein
VTAAALRLYLSPLVPGMTPLPAPRLVAEAFESLTVTQTDSGVSSGWQISLRAQRTSSPADDYALVSHPLLQPFTRLVASVSLGVAERVLVDGAITHIEVNPAQRGTGALLTVTGDSIDAVMDLHDFTIPWPALPDAAIVEGVLAKYIPFGLRPTVVPPIPSADMPNPFEKVVVQNETDMAFLNRLAAPYGYVFYVVPGPAVGVNTAYWGPPPRFLPPQKALGVDLGSFSNVNALSFSYSAKGPTLVFGAVQSEFFEGEFPVMTTMPIRMPPLAARPAITALLPFVRGQIYGNPAAEIARAMYEANAITHRSTDQVVTAHGSLDTARYNHILEVPGVVGVRGAGTSYDGNYYVNSVTHHLSLGSYTQDFQLSREGAGTTTTKVVA